MLETAQLMATIVIGGTQSLNSLSAIAEGLHNNVKINTFKITIPVLIN